MEGLINHVKSSSCLLVIMLVFLGCSRVGGGTLGHTGKPFYISFSSVYDKDTLSLFANDSLLLDRVLINTERSLGIDLRNSLTIHSELKYIHLKGSFKAQLKSEGVEIERILDIDTILKASKGRSIILQARHDNYTVYQKRGKIKLE